VGGGGKKNGEERNKSTEREGGFEMKTNGVGFWRRESERGGVERIHRDF
jgi:hypothetical protein